MTCIRKTVPPKLLTVKALSDVAEHIAFRQHHGICTPLTHPDSCVLHDWVLEHTDLLGKYRGGLPTHDTLAYRWERNLYDTCTLTASEMLMNLEPWLPPCP